MFAIINTVDAFNSLVTADPSIIEWIKLHNFLFENNNSKAASETK